ncbi:hypothetical protein C0J52_08342 [Blattella germanica]|nr:hypothetical protein C0J52_08342 [Blattella germanica]
MWRTLFILFLGFLGVSSIEELYYWKLVDFEFPNQQTRDLAIRSGYFRPNNTLLLDADFTGTGKHLFNLHIKDTLKNENR